MYGSGSGGPGLVATTADVCSKNIDLSVKQTTRGQFYSTVNHGPAHFCLRKPLFPSFLVAVVLLLFIMTYDKPTLAQVTSCI